MNLLRSKSILPLVARTPTCPAPTTTPPLAFAIMYCGDETGAFIGDIGSHTARFGYGGEDCPKVVVPSAVYHHYSDGSDDRTKSTNNVRRGKYSAPVSLMNLPPNDCFRFSSLGSEEGVSSPSITGGKTGGEVGFVPIYQSMNSNIGQHDNSSGIADDGAIQDIDAWACLWEYSYQALCVRGKKKHTVGHEHSMSDTSHFQSESQSKPISSQSIQDIPIDHPLLVVDSTNRAVENTLAASKSNEKQKALMLETLFESLSAPAAYLAPSAMLSCFAYGRQNALVVDVGHTGSRVTPIVDGYLLKYGSVKSGRGGRWLGSVQQSVLEGEWDNGPDGNNTQKWNGWAEGMGGGVPPCHLNGVLPRYLLHSNYRHQTNQERKIQLSKQSPFHSMTIHEAMYEMITSSHVLPLDITMASSAGIVGGDVGPSAPFCGYGYTNENENYGENDKMVEDKKEDEEKGSANNSDGEDDIIDGPHYELPDGTIVDLAKARAGRDLCRLPELLFSETLPTFIQPPSKDNYEYNNSMLPLQHLIHQSLNQILDADIRKELCTSILLTGASSLLPRMDKRISLELGEILPSSHKCKVIASKNDVERRYGAWIGGSILSSLGSFQQLWLSRKEYEECGSILGLQRFQ